MQLGQSIGRVCSKKVVSIETSKQGRLLSYVNTNSAQSNSAIHFSHLFYKRFYTHTVCVLVFLASVVSHPALAYDVNNDLASFINSDEEPIQPIPLATPSDPAIVDLGKKLFFDKRLSKDLNVSCADCHQLSHGGADNLSHSLTASGKQTSYNTPTIFNVLFNGSYYWNAELSSLEKELSQSIVNLDTDWTTIQRRLSTLAEYSDPFDRYFSDGVTVKNIQHCLLNYEKSLITPNSKFDRYLNGNRNALSKSEIHGYALFKNYGCIACHQGINVGGNLAIAIEQPSLSARAATIAFHKRKPSKSRTKRIRVPGLRNVSKTAPYFHDGSVSNLNQAVKIEARIHSNVNLSDSESLLIVEFLNSLTGQLQGRQL